MAGRLADQLEVDGDEAEGRGDVAGVAVRVAGQPPAVAAGGDDLRVDGGLADGRVVVQRLVDLERHDTTEAVGSCGTVPSSHCAYLVAPPSLLREFVPCRVDSLLRESSPCYRRLEHKTTR